MSCTRRRGGKKSREMGGKICNALFKAKQTYPDMPALRFWKPGWKEWGKPQCGCQEPFERWRRPWIAKRMFREEDSVGNSTVASDAFIACCIEDRRLLKFGCPFPSTHLYFMLPRVGTGRGCHSSLSSYKVPHTWMFDKHIMTLKYKSYTVGMRCWWRLVG